MTATPSAPAVPRPARVGLMGLDLDPIAGAGVVATALHELAEGRGGWICPANLDVLRQVVASPELGRLVGTADLVVADGMPLVWASRVQGAALPERVAGSALVHELAAAAAPAGASVYLLGGDPGVADAAAGRLRALHPALRVAGTACPPRGFETSEPELERIGAALAAAAPDIVFVGLGFPKQERLIVRLRSVLPHAWFVSVGGGLAMASGDLVRAPRWMQRTGLEWAHRLAQEPRRLARRYLVDGLPFAARVMAGAARRRCAAWTAASS